MPDDILELSPLPAPRPARLRGRRYRIGPLSTRSDRAVPTVGAGIRKGALAGLSVVAVLAVPFFLVLGARAPAPQAFATAPVAESAKVWTDSDAAVPPAPTRTAEARPVAPLAEPLPAPSAAPTGLGRAPERNALSVALIPVLDDESGDLSIGEAAPPAEAAPVRPAPMPASRASAAARP